MSETRDTDSQTFSRRKGVSPLSRNVSSWLSPALKKRGFAEHRILTEWRDIVGDALADECSPQKLTSAKNKPGEATLTIEVYNPGAALELQYQQNLIIEKIAVYFGYRAINRIRLVQRTDPLPKKKHQELRDAPLPEEVQLALDNEVASVEDPELKEALGRLGKSRWLRKKKGKK